METFIIFGNGFGKLQRKQRAQIKQQLSVPSVSSVVNFLCHNPINPEEIKKPHFVMVAITSDIRAIHTIRIIRVLMLLILNKIYDTNFTNVMNAKNLVLTELWGAL